MNTFFQKIKWMRWVILSLALFCTGLILLMKFDTKWAAEFTDSFLRPALGADKVLFLEKTFFNTSDQIERWTTNPNTIQSPQFGNQIMDTTNISGGNLDLAPIFSYNNFSPLPHEGVWHNWPLRLFPGKEVMAYTFIRSDPDRSYAITTLAQMDLSVMRMGSVAGRKEPGGPVGQPGSGVIPSDIIQSGNLIAAFDGGFQYRDGAYGMMVGNTTYLPLKNDLGTLVGYNDGSVKIVDYTGQSLGNDVAFVRQNCPILIENGNIMVTNPRNKSLWGRLARGTSDIFTWRSGIGLTAKGNLLFAVGNNLTPETLAAALQLAGAVNAIQLDINPIWVRFNIFDTLGGGKYNSTKLNKDLEDGSYEYLHGYDKDFFYVYKK